MEQSPIQYHFKVCTAEGRYVEGDFRFDPETPDVFYARSCSEQYGWQAEPNVLKLFPTEAELQAQQDTMNLIARNMACPD